MNEQNKETALSILKLESQLQQVSEQVKAQIDFYNQTKAEIEELKKRLKEETTGKVKESISLGDNTLDISITDRNTVVVSDETQVPEEYTTTVQVDNVFQAPNGKFYQRIPNTKLVSNYLKAGLNPPAGFDVKKSRSISIKFNGKTL